MEDPDDPTLKSKTTHQDHESRLKLYGDRRRQKKQQPEHQQARAKEELREELVRRSQSERSLQQQQVEVDDDDDAVFASYGAKILAVDMPAFMQIHAVDCARKTHDSLEKFRAKPLALTLKKEFDEAYGPAWHCIVGKSFGSFVTHSVGAFLYFSMDHNLYILLFKTAVQRATT